MTEPGESHSLRLASTKSTANEIIARNDSIVGAVYSVTRNDGTALVVFEGALPIGPVIVSVLGLEILHEGPVVTPVAPS